VVLPETDLGVNVGDMPENPWDKNLLLNLFEQFAETLFG